MIGLTSSSQLAITSMVNFPRLLILNFKCTASFFDIFNTEVTPVLAKISMCSFLDFSHTFISACFDQSIRGEIVSYFFLIFTIGNCSRCCFFKKLRLKLSYLPLCLESSLSLCIIWWGKSHGKLSIVRLLLLGKKLRSLISYIIKELFLITGSKSWFKVSVLNFFKKSFYAQKGAWSIFGP